MLIAYYTSEVKKILEYDMKRRIIATLSLFGMIAASAVFIPSNASALSLTTGTPLIAIDGDSDSNVTVRVFSASLPIFFSYGYFLNGAAAFTTLDPFSLNTFQGGDVIDLAIYNPFNLKYYTLSGDSADDSYSVAMNLGGEVLTGAPQQPADWTSPYYYNANITWSIPSVINTNELAINFSNGNDGLSTSSVPEPASLLLMGSGLVGYALMRRRKNS